MLMTEAEEQALNDVQVALAEAEAHLEQLRSSKDNLMRRTRVTCRCGANYAIGDLVYIQTHWYVTPSGCCEGDYYRSGEGQWDCPTCGRNNRLYNKPEIEKLERHFKSILSCYCNQDHSCCSDPTPCKACQVAGRTRDGRTKT